MNLTEAIHIRAQQLQGKPVLALALKEALDVIHDSRPRPKGGRPHKFRLPVLNAAMREHMNAVLAYRLGIAIGRIEERKVA